MVKQKIKVTVNSKNYYGKQVGATEYYANKLQSGGWVGHLSTGRGLFSDRKRFKTKTQAKAWVDSEIKKIYQNQVN